jgi:hypothetical protein
MEQDKKKTYIHNSDQEPASTDCDLGRCTSVDMVVDTNDGKYDGDSGDHCELETMDGELICCDCQAVSGQLKVLKGLVKAYNRWMVIALFFVNTVAKR